VHRNDDKKKTPDKTRQRQGLETRARVNTTTMRGAYFSCRAGRRSSSNVCVPTWVAPCLEHGCCGDLTAPCLSFPNHPRDKEIAIAPSVTFCESTITTHERAKGVWNRSLGCDRGPCTVEVHKRPPARGAGGGLIGAKWVSYGGGLCLCCCRWQPGTLGSS
jgi:hypothetical protein